MPLLPEWPDLPLNLDGASPEVADRARPLARALARYHRHEVVGMQHVPVDTAALMVMNHSLATYDGLLMALAVEDATGRLPVGLGDDLLFRTPGLRHVVRGAGIVPASPENGRALLARGHLVAVAPGGMREALRPSTERYTVRWDRRKGFVRLALEAGVPIVLAACPAADDLYQVYETRLTKLAYKHLRVPIPFVRGLGPTWIPRPVKLVHHVAPPIVPPALDPERVDDQIEALHAEIVRTMDALMERGATT